MRKDIPLRENEIRNWIEENFPKSYICRKLKCKPETFDRYLKKMGINYKGNMGLKGKKSGIGRKNALHYINSNAIIRSASLREKLIDDRIKKRICERCGLSEWLNGKIPLELHHKDGNHHNNTLNNLEILCPNCHAIESNNSGKAVGKVSTMQDIETNGNLTNQASLFW